MNILDLKAGSPEWLSHRRNRITATDVPIIMGHSPYKTPYELFEQKVYGITDGVLPKEVLELADLAERLAHSWALSFLKQEGMSLQVFCDDEDSGMSATLDIADFQSSTLIEAKYVGFEMYERIKLGDVPKHFYYQIQTQLMITGISRAYLFAMAPSHEYHTVVITPDKAAWVDIEVAVKEFQERIKTGNEPELTTRDWLTIESPLLSEMRELTLKKKELDTKLEELREQATKVFTHPRVRSEGVTWQRQISKGNVNYKIIPELQGVDLEKYRGKARESWVLRVK